MESIHPIKYAIHFQYIRTSSRQIFVHLQPVLPLHRLHQHPLNFAIQGHHSPITYQFGTRIDFTSSRIIRCQFPFPTHDLHPIHCPVRLRINISIKIRPSIPLHLLYIQQHPHRVVTHLISLLPQTVMYLFPPRHHPISKRIRDFRFKFPSYWTT